MPELPEVEVIKKSLNHRLKKQSITNVWTSKFRMRSQLTAQDQELVKGKMIAQVSRIGKFLVIQLPDSFLLLHFGMSGRLLIAQNNEELNKISTIVNKLSAKVKDEVIRIKLDEVSKAIKPLSNKDRINDNHLVNLMQYYDLVNELKTL